MICFTLAAIFGSTILQYFSYLPAIQIGLFVTVISLIIYGLKPNILTRSCLGFIIGLSWTTFWAQNYLNDCITPSLEGIPITVIGTIVTVPDQEIDHARFKFIVKDTFTDKYKGLVNNQILLSWYGKERVHFNQGQQWQFTIKIKRPHGLANPGGFDYERYLFLEDIHATGYVLPNKPMKQLENNDSINIFNVWREDISEQLGHYLNNRIGLGFIEALTIGYRQHLSTEMWLVLQKTGTAHLMAISGLHVGLVSGFVFFIACFLCKKIIPPNKHINPVQVASAIAMVGAIIYSGLAGFSLPTFRAVVMICVLMSLQIFKRRVIGWNLLALAAMIILFVDPFATFRAGFWLSFGAVAWIYYLLQHRPDKQSNWQFAWRMQLLLSIGLLPVTLLWFQQASIISPIANLIAVPWVSFIVAPLALSGVVLLGLVPSLSEWILSLASYTIEWLYIGLEKLAVLPYASMNLFHLSTIHYLFLFVVFLLLLLPRAMPARYLSGVILLPIIFYNKTILNEGDVEFTLLDVGQGLSAVIETKEHVLIFDTGLKSSESSDSSTTVLVPFFRNQGIKQADALIISHNDNDHIGGAKSLINNLPVKKIYSSENLPFLAKNRVRCEEGFFWEWDSVRFEFLHPTSVSRFKRNDLSCVLKITTGENDILLTGDIEKNAEQQLVRRYGDKLAADILVVPHHGSKTSSTPSFVEKVSPQYALYPLGYLNRFGFPHSSVQNTYDERSIITLSTADNGAISFLLNSDEKKLVPVKYREFERRFWFAG